MLAPAQTVQLPIGGGVSGWINARERQFLRVFSLFSSIVIRKSHLQGFEINSIFGVMGDI